MFPARHSWLFLTALAVPFQRAELNPANPKKTIGSDNAGDFPSLPLEFPVVKPTPNSRCAQMGQTALPKQIPQPPCLPVFHPLGGCLFLSSAAAGLRLDGTPLCPSQLRSKHISIYGWPGVDHKKKKKKSIVRWSLHASQEKLLPRGQTRDK